MRAAVLRGGQLIVRETADPEPGEGELLVRTLATALCASDVHFMDHPESVEGDPAQPVALGEALVELMSEAGALELLARAEEWAA